MKKLISIPIALLPFLVLTLLMYIFILLIRFYGLFFLLELLEIVPFKYETYKFIAYITIIAIHILVYWKTGKFLFQVLLGLLGIINRKDDSKTKLIKQYFTFLSDYVRSDNLAYLMKSHTFFFRYIFFEDFTIPHHMLGVFKSPLQYQSQVGSFNDLCMKQIGKDNYVKNVEITNEYFNCHIHKGSLDGKTLVEKIESKRDEITKFFTTSTFEANMKVEHKNYSDVVISIYNEQSLWENKAIALGNFNVLKGSVLGGFFPDINKGVRHSNYFIKISELIHSFVTGATRSGKNVFMDNIILSVLYNIKMYNNLELHFFDTKGNDTTYLDNLQSHGIHRYTDIQKYPDIFLRFVNEIRKTQELIGEYSNIYNYNEHHPENPLKEKIIIINEFLSLSKQFTGRDLQNLLGALVSITSESAGAGYKCIFMSQTIRKDSSPMLSEILLNIKTRFVLKANNREEVEMNARGLSDAEKARIIHMRQYNCFHVEDGSIQQEFKAYYLTQQVIKEWIDRNFQRETPFKNIKINEYLQYAKTQDGIFYKEATEKFGLTRSDWNTLIQFLEGRNEIERMPNNAIVWRKKTQKNVTSLLS